MASDDETTEDTRGKEIVLRLGQLGVEVAAQALQLGLASSFINCVVDVWRIKGRPKQEELAAALLARNPDLMELLEAAAGGEARGLRADELELIGVGMSALSPSANTARIERMAKLVSDGLGATEIETSRAKRLARLLSQLDDDHLLVLMRQDKTATNEERERIAAMHPQLFSPPPSKPNMMLRLSAGFVDEPRPPPPTEAEVREQANQGLHLKLCSEHLQSLGLLNYEPTENGPNTTAYNLSRAGHEFMAAIGLLSMSRNYNPPATWW
ncbi:MAG: hypothetical protein JWM33_660 [Caulobacteraceae bacterium]|nr:hypothetical protein [Caulobacteraceae bacterium]